MEEIRLFWVLWLLPMLIWRKANQVVFFLKLCNSFLLQVTKDSLCFRIALKNCLT